MSATLRNIRLTSIDLVQEGANQEADICLFKSYTPMPGCNIMQTPMQPLSRWPAPQQRWGKPVFRANRRFDWLVEVTRAPRVERKEEYR